MDGVYLSLGSNMGDRAQYLKQALKELEKNPRIRVIKTSSLYESEPWGIISSNDQKFDWFLNQCVKIETSLEPLPLLSALEKIERKLGRTKKGEYKSRTIDIDILLYADKVIDLLVLKVPHPFMTKRKFVLIPLFELDPKLRDPVSKKLLKRS